MALADKYNDKYKEPHGASTLYHLGEHNSHKLHKCNSKTTAVNQG